MDVAALAFLAVIVVLCSLSVVNGIADSLTLIDSTQAKVTGVAAPSRLYNRELGERSWGSGSRVAMIGGKLLMVPYFSTLTERVVYW